MIDGKKDVMSFLRELLTKESKKERIWIPVIELTTVFEETDGIRRLRHSVDRALLVFDTKGKEVHFIERFGWDESLATIIDIFDAPVFYHAVKLIKAVGDEYDNAQQFPQRKICYLVYDSLLWAQMRQVFVCNEDDNFPPALAEKTQLIHHTAG